MQGFVAQRLPHDALSEQGYRREIRQKVHHRSNGHSPSAVLIHRCVRIIGPVMLCSLWNEFGRHEETQLIAGLRMLVEDLLEPGDGIELGFRLLQRLLLFLA